MKAKPVRTAAEIARLDDEDLLTIQEVMAWLQVSRAFVWRLCKDGKLQKYHVGSKGVRFYVRDIRKLIQ